MLHMREIYTCPTKLLQQIFNIEAPAAGSLCHVAMGGTEIRALRAWLSADVETLPHVRDHRSEYLLRTKAS
jgi:hypothetical protein